jgi:hypothetical protein
VSSISNRNMTPALARRVLSWVKRLSRVLKKAPPRCGALSYIVECFFFIFLLEWLFFILLLVLEAP